MAVAAFALLALVALLGNVQCQFDRREPADEIYAECVDKVMDIFFILDSSTSIYVNDFRSEREFVRDAVNRFDISDRNTRVGVMTFSDDYTRPVLGLSRFQTKSEIVSSVNERNLPYRTGVTNTHLAIRYVRQSTEFREDITKVIVVITDGGSRDPYSTSREAQRAREQGFYVFVVGIGQYQDENEWNQIASDPDSQFVFNTTNFRGLSPLADQLPRRACPLPPIIIGGFCNVDQAANLMYVAAPGASEDALFLIDNFMDRSDDQQGRLRVNYFLEACNSATNREHGDISNVCNRFGNFGETTADSFANLVRLATDNARSDPRSRSSNQVAVLFVDTDTMRLDRFGFETNVQQLQSRGVDVIVVDLTPFSQAQSVQNVLRDRNNYIRFAGQSVAGERNAQRTLIDQTCVALNDRNGLTFNPV